MAYSRKNGDSNCYWIPSMLMKVIIDKLEQVDIYTSQPYTLLIDEQLVNIIQTQ
uniref:Uncharacterized protein n=1 Tax=Rhizophora mucronata TaxID=61149 RepID=A0A2P2PMD2_RHIMU